MKNYAYDYQAIAFVVVIEKRENGKDFRARLLYPYSVDQQGDDIDFSVFTKTELDQIKYEAKEDFINASKGMKRKYEFFDIVYEYKKEDIL